MKPDAPTFAALAEERRHELIALLSALIEAASEAGQSAAGAQSVLARYLEAAGYDIELVMDGTVSRPRDASRSDEPLVNVIARPATRTNDVALFAHIDTEHPTAGWTLPPCTPRIRDGRLYGLGAADDKAGVAAAAVAAAALAETGGPAPLVLSVHGKNGGARGTQPAFTRLDRLDAALYLHPAETGRGLAEIKHASRGVLDITVSIEGWHGSEREIGRPDSVRFDEGGNALEACLAAVDRWRSRELEGCEVNVGRITAGETAGTIPTRCDAELRIVFDEPLCAGELLSRIAADLAAVASVEYAPGRRFHAHVVNRGLCADPARLAWDHPWCRTVAQTTEAVVGTRPQPYEGHLASDIRFPIRLLKAPAVGVGSLAGNFCGADEWVDLDDVMRLVSIAMQSVWAWCEGERA